MLLNRIIEASEKIAPHILKTPMQYSYKLSEITGANVYLKCEHVQHTGSFKLRGALNKVLSSKNLTQKVIAASTGNHGFGVATAAKIAGQMAEVVLPENTPKFKIDIIRALGASVFTVAGDCLAAELTARSRADQQNAIFISPYNDIDVIAGQGTLGIEIHQQCPEADAVFISVGGGGLISGVGHYLKHHNRKVNLVGCWPENSCSMFHCLKTGKYITIDESPTLSDSTAGGVESGAITLDYCKEIIDSMELVSEQQIAKAMKLIADHDKWMIEGAAGVALGALLQNDQPYRGKNVVILLCGRNILLEKFIKAVT